jgi:hypothetical protein
MTDAWITPQRRHVHPVLQKHRKCILSKPYRWCMCIYKSTLYKRLEWHRLLCSLPLPLSWCCHIVPFTIKPCSLLCSSCVAESGYAPYTCSSLRSPCCSNSWFQWTSQWSHVIMLMQSLPVLFVAIMSLTTTTNKQCYHNALIEVKQWRATQSAVFLRRCTCNWSWFGLCLWLPITAKCARSSKPSCSLPQKIYNCQEENANQPFLFVYTGGFLIIEWRHAYFVWGNTALIQLSSLEIII